MTDGVRTLRVHEHIGASLRREHVGWFTPHAGILVEITDVDPQQSHTGVHLGTDQWAAEIDIALGGPVLLVDPSEVIVDE